MISVLAACILGNVSLAADAVPTNAPTTATTVVAAAPQGPRIINRKGPGVTTMPPSGGTPEPATILLLAGGALTYGGMRMRSRRKQQRSA